MRNKKLYFANEAASDALKPGESMHPDGGYPDTWEPLIGKDYRNDPGYALWYARLVAREGSKAPADMQSILDAVNRSNKVIPSESRSMTGFPKQSVEREIQRQAAIESLGADANIKILPFLPALPIWAWLLIAFLIYYGVKKLT